MKKYLLIFVFLIGCTQTDCIYDNYIITAVKLSEDKKYNYTYTVNADDSAAAQGKVANSLDYREEFHYYSNNKHSIGDRITFKSPGEVEVTR